MPRTAKGNGQDGAKDARQEVGAVENQAHQQEGACQEEDGKTLEETFQELEEIIEKMQKRETALEESFALYEQGIRKLKSCSQKIDRVEKKMLLLNHQGELEAF